MVRRLMCKARGPAPLGPYFGIQPKFLAASVCRIPPPCLNESVFARNSALLVLTVNRPCGGSPETWSKFTHRSDLWSARFLPRFLADSWESSNSVVWLSFLMGQNSIRTRNPLLVPRRRSRPSPNQRGTGGYSIPSLTKTSPYFRSSPLTDRTPAPF